MTRKNQSGQALIAAVVGLGILLMGFAGLGIDMGYLRYEKRLLQTAADGAAIAGASELLYGTSGVTAAANHDATSNGFLAATANVNQCPPSAPATDVGSVAVTVNNPPCSGPHNGDAKYVEVYVAQVQPTFFMRILGITSETVTARAVAALTGSGSGCVYTLGTSGDGILLNGTASIVGPQCGIVVDSNLNVNGTPSITSGSIGAATGSCGSSNCMPPAVIGIVPQPDPLGYLTSPPASGACLADPSINKTTTTINPGHYCSGISITGGANVTFNPGVYVLGNGTVGGMDASGAGNITASGVMFYNTAGTFSMSGSGTLNLTAPNVSDSSTGAIAGVLFWQGASDIHDVTFSGNPSNIVQGTIYAPSAQLTMNGTNSLTKYTLLVVNSLRLNGTNNLNLNADTSGVTGGSPIKSALLVE
jgi:hypothetical protein